MTGDDVRALLVESGQWTALRARPFGRVADPAARPHSIFVTAMDTNPLGPSVAAIVAGCDAPFERGLAALARLTDGPVFVCTGPDPGLPIPERDQIRHEVFDGVHPAGTVGFHIHTLDAVDRNKVVWHLGVQDAIAIGRLFETGVLDAGRIVSLGGPPVTEPRLLRSRIGASTDELVEGMSRLRAQPTAVPATGRASTGSPSGASSPVRSCPAGAPPARSTATLGVTTSRCRCLRRVANGNSSAGSVRG